MIAFPGHTKGSVGVILSSDELFVRDAMQKQYFMGMEERVKGMKKLFKAIRSNDMEEVKAILQKKPEAISSISTPPPKKDIGQSPLQVAVKIGAFDIAYYLIEQGADVNFMEEEAEGVTWRTPVLHDAIRTVFQSLCYERFAVSEKGLLLLKTLLEKGADPNKCASNGFAAIDECVAQAENILERQSAYTSIQEITEKRLTELLDILIDHGADFEHWAQKGHFPEPNPGESNQVRYLDDFMPVPDKVQEYTVQGEVMSTVIKGDIDRTAHTRKVMQDYCRKRGFI